METLTGKKRRTSTGGGGRAAKQAQRKRAWFAELLPGCGRQAEERRCRHQRWGSCCYLVGELRTSAANPRGWRGLRAAAPRGRCGGTPRLEMRRAGQPSDKPAGTPLLQLHQPWTFALQL